ncbi:MAG: succinate dehydrogenase [Phycisphaerales bacterium]|nr:succinate dehydrogenase [Phycisphaerales bacterium]
MSMADVQLPQQRRFGETKRLGAWWLPSLLVFLGFAAFIVYSTWAALQGQHYFVPGTHYLSPMYSPVLWDSWMQGQGHLYRPSGHAWFGEWPAWLPTHVLNWKWAVIPLTPAFLILWAPGGFRFTCYYYRGAYYKAFWADPVACAVGEPRKTYLGEKYLPLVLQNSHRWFMYLAVVFIFLLSYDAIVSYFFPVGYGAGGVVKSEFGIGIGTLVLTINPILLGAYTFGCHSLRHLVGGRRDSLAGLGARKPVYDCVSCLNRRHMMWAWLSLFWVGFTDLYVRMVSMGVWHDYRIL